MIRVNWGFVDKVVYINLAKRTDRRESIEFQLKKMAVPPEKIIRFEAIEHDKGALGCAMSHVAVLTMAKENNWQNVLILEDDMVFNDDDESHDRINYFFSSLVSTDWDAGFLSGSYFKIKQKHGCFYQVFRSYLSNSYIVNQHYYDELIAVFDVSIEKMNEGIIHRNYCSLDVYWHYLMQRDDWYAIYPCVGYQLVDMSDIEGYMTDRVCYFSRTIDEM
ncbi:glycosyltransferase family 25 protein [Morganella psychrotolerans]|uniref:glycosyltransferase family 25 protein n=1 Tax=Morganella psychrotolerans TaxID=368603 RepID=UPI0039AF2344